MLRRFAPRNDDTQSPPRLDDDLGVRFRIGEIGKGLPTAFEIAEIKSTLQLSRTRSPQLVPDFPTSVPHLQKLNRSPLPNHL